MKSLSIALLLCLAPLPVFAGEIEFLSHLTFNGEILAPENISAVAVLADGEFLVIGGDEGQEIQVLRRSGEDEYTADHSILLNDDGSDKEIDIEGLALSDDRLYVVGSHSRKRSKLNPTEKTRKENRKRLEENVREPLRENLFELRMNNEGNLTAEVEVKSLRERIENDSVLAPFLELPSKENGVDIEGIAAVGDKLYVGFRGPVLREGYVPVLVFDFDKPDKAKTRYVNLGGRGIRDLVRVDNGFLLIGGPVGGEPVSFEIYRWDGEDGIAGKDVPTPEVPKSLGVIPSPDSEAKAEGMAVLDETDTHYDVLIVFDGPRNGSPTRFRVQK